MEGDLLIGHHTPTLEELDGDPFSDESYFMIVNLLKDQNTSAAGATQQITVDFDFGASNINSLQRLNRNTGQVETMPLTPMGGALFQLDISLPGGTRDLFKYNTGAPFVHGLSLEHAWNVDATGTWSVGHHWIGGVPNGNDVAAKLGDVIQSAKTVVVDQDITLKSLTIDSTNAYQVAGSGSIMFEHTDATMGELSSIHVIQGTHQLQAGVALSNNTIANVADRASLGFNNVLDLGGNTLQKTGLGTLTLNTQLNSNEGTIHVEEGILSASGTIGGDVVIHGGTLAPGNRPGLSVVGTVSEVPLPEPNMIFGIVLNICLYLIYGDSYGNQRKNVERLPCRGNPHTVAA